MYSDASLYIDGQFIAAEGRAQKEIVNPATNQVIGTMPCADAADLDHAIESAHHAFKLWKNTSPMQRSDVLRTVAKLTRERAEQIGRNITLDQGKPLREAIAEVSVCAEHAEWHAEECRRIYGRVIPARAANVEQMVVREPVGVCVAFTPWNFPFNQTIRKVSAAIGAGCSIIVKGSGDTPSAVMAIAQLFHDAGLPKGVLNVVWGDSDFISNHLIRSPLVRKISFTGSTPVGKRLAALAASHMKPATMELGGHAPVVVCDDADIEAAVKHLAASKFRNAGQVCICPTRFYVQQNVYQAFTDLFLERVRAINVGDGLDPTNHMGPLAQTRRVAAMQAFVDDAVSHGAKVFQGGAPRGTRGNYFPPTVLTKLSNDCLFMNDEPFGPVVGIVPFDTLENVLEEANRLPYGLAAYGFTKSSTNAHLLSRELQAGMVSINHIGLALAETPFGGIKDSGYGSEGGIETFDGYLNTKFVSKLH